MTQREINIAGAIASLWAFWWFLHKVDPAPKALRWATWW